MHLNYSASVLSNYLILFKYYEDILGHRIVLPIMPSYCFSASVLFLAVFLPLLKIPLILPQLSFQKTVLV